jgi:hypothetical protein
MNNQEKQDAYGDLIKYFKSIQNANHDFDSVALINYDFLMINHLHQR